MTYRGHVKNGIVVLDEPAMLPEGAEVRVSLAVSTVNAEASTAPTLYESLQDVIGAIDDLPSDFAANHDHYLYGTPKRS